MGSKEKRIDEYIKKSGDFAWPILNHLRQLVHSACPEVVESIKWSFPCFDYKGPFCSMAAFKEHCAFGFWKAAIMQEAKILKENQESSMGSLGKIRSLTDLPADKILVGYIHEAKRLNDEGIKLPPRKKNENTTLFAVPEYILKALNKNKAASLAFEAFSPSHRKEYVQWITEAKTEATKHKRLAKAIEQIAEGKGVNWKYTKPVAKHS